jgi:hypothetical protein
MGGLRGEGDGCEKESEKPGGGHLYQRLSQGLRGAGNLPVQRRWLTILEQATRGSKTRAQATTLQGRHSSEARIAIGRMRCAGARKAAR